jgi:hypothetical protein
MLPAVLFENFSFRLKEGYTGLLRVFESKVKWINFNLKKYKQQEASEIYLLG